jgi:formylglycine-generating enzyme required for sulfatase activity
MIIEFNFSIALIIILLTYSCSKEGDTAPSDTGNSKLPTSIILKDISAGTFTMGGTTNAGDAPTVSIILTSFKISEKEITNQQYIDFLNNAYLDGWITVSSQSTSDPCGT